MKLILPFLILFTSVGFAQDNSAAQQGIAIVEQMEKEQEAQKLPDFCKSTKKKDKVACANWMKANARFQQASESEGEPDLAAAHQGIAIMRQMEKDEQAQGYPDSCKSHKAADKKHCEEWVRAHMNKIQNSPDYKKKQAAEKQELAKKHKAQEEALKKSKCDDPYFTEEEQYFCRMKMYENVSSEDRLSNCVMSMDAREITCGDKIYTLSGQVSNGARFNNKLDLESGSRPNKGQSGNSKANKQ